MNCEEKVYSVLSAAAGVTALCPAARIKVPGNWQNLPRPYVIHFPVSVAPIQTHEGLAAMRIWDYYQVSCVADTYSATRALAEAVISALNGQHSGLMALYESEFALRDSETNTEQIALNFRVAFAQT